MGNLDKERLQLGHLGEIKVVEVCERVAVEPELEQVLDGVVKCKALCEHVEREGDDLELIHALKCLHEPRPLCNLDKLTHGLDELALERQARAADQAVALQIKRRASPSRGR